LIAASQVARIIGVSHCQQPECLSSTGILSVGWKEHLWESTHREVVRELQEIWSRALFHQMYVLSYLYSFKLCISINHPYGFSWRWIFSGDFYH
jgi:hypothetical protein